MQTTPPVLRESPMPSTAGHGPSKGFRSDLAVLRAYFRTPKQTRRTSAGRKKRNRMRAATPLAPAQKQLLDCAHQHRLTEAELMNRLQNLGLVSDNAVWLHEVAESDCRIALPLAPWIA